MLGVGRGLGLCWVGGLGARMQNDWNADLDLEFG